MPANRSKTATASSTPVLTPPGEARAEAGAGDQAAPARPRDLTTDELTVAALEGSEAVGPKLEPPTAGARGSEGVTAWQSDKRIVALFSSADPRNVWVAVGGVGWKRLFNANDSALEAMAIIVAHAKQLNSPVNYREEADGLIHEVYAW